MMAGTTSSNLAALGTKDINLNSDDESQRRMVSEMPNLNAERQTGDQLIDKKTNNQSQLNNLGDIKEVTGAFFTGNMLSNENCNKFSNGLIWQEDLVNNNNEINSRTTNHSHAGKVQKTHFNENKTSKMSQISDKKQSETPIAKN